MSKTEIKILTHEQIRAAGGIVHRDGNIFFTSIEKLNDAIAAIQAQGVPDHCDPSCTSYELAAMVMSDCGHSTNNQRLLDRIAARIDKHVESVLASAPPAQQAVSGWQAHAKALEHELAYWKQRAQTMHEHQKGECWYWQGDGNDHPESMVGSLPVVIRADALRAQMTPQASVVQQEAVAVIGPAFQVLWTRQAPLEGLHVGDSLYTHPAQQAKPQPLSDSQALEIFNDLEKFMDQIEDEEVTDEYMAGQSLRFILDRVAAMKGTPCP